MTSPAPEDELYRIESRFEGPGSTQNGHFSGIHVIVCSKDDDPELRDLTVTNDVGNVQFARWQRERKPTTGEAKLGAASRVYVDRNENLLLEQEAAFQASDALLGQGLPVLELPLCTIAYEGHRTITTIVKKLIPQWKNGLYPTQHHLVARVLDGEDILCCMATGGGKSALFSVPILILREMARNPRLYPDLPTRALPQGIVITPTKGLAANIVLELKKLDIMALAYRHETVTEARMTGRNLVEEISQCRTWNVICVDPEHPRDKAWCEITASNVYRTNVVYGCTDNAHLINEWGADFRPPFKHIGRFFRGHLPSSTSILALSATLQPGSATKSVLSSLGMRQSVKQW
ncbi:P-loop containing nucleoside triphosphate hydrolase protein [Mycena capillaripes]|nr:P-loop containing nucleoside triphosphate hydrolase protein [Mycena capillaripes]